MGCGASTAAQVVPTPHSDPLLDAHQKKEPPEGTATAAEARETPAALDNPAPETGPVRAAPAANDGDVLEGLLVALEESAEARSATPRGAQNEAHAHKAHEQPGEAQGAVEELLRELDGPPPAVALPDLHLRSSARVLAPLKVHGRPAVSAGPLQGMLPVVPPVVPLGPRQPTHALQGGLRDGGVVAEEPPDSATLLTLKHRDVGGMVVDRMGSSGSVGSPSTAGTTYITFDLLAGEHMRHESEAEASAGAGQGQESENSGSGLRTDEQHVGAPSAQLEQTASEVDELLRDVFHEERLPESTGRAVGADTADKACWGTAGKAGRVEESSSISVSSAISLRTAGMSGHVQGSTLSDTAPSDKNGKRDSLGDGGAVRQVEVGVRGDPHGSGAHERGPAPIPKERNGSNGSKIADMMQGVAMPRSNDAAAGVSSGRAANGAGHEGGMSYEKVLEASVHRVDSEGAPTRSWQPVEQPGAVPMDAGDVLLDVEDLEEISGQEEAGVADATRDGGLAPPLGAKNGAAGAGVRVSRMASVAALSLSVRVGAEGDADEWGHSDSDTHRRRSSMSDAVGMNEQWQEAGPEGGDSDVLVLDTWDLEDQG